ncbi:GNAT family N-acetyltransferase [Euzebya sp.]|uniref:GNAT family N-acetyltransferase n=1 Tax=Euzebya sp. TaxID=1971409 RepID=UPI003511EDDE
MTITVRPIRPSEHARAGEITVAAYDAIGAVSDDYRVQLADVTERVADGADVLVAVDGVEGADDRVLGTVTYVDEDNPHFENHGAGDCGFRMLAVDTAAQGRGAGRLLVQACIDLAVARGRRRMAIYSMEWMPVAHGMYAAMGFTRRPDRDVVFPGGVGFAFQLDLVRDADRHFPPPGPVPDEPPWYLDAWGIQSRAAGGTAHDRA